ncbi:hypothetical protein NL676_010218 [Syzygium grande]|nr:hypothetical protein NL676_010218 [Syzygium grande]
MRPPAASGTDVPTSHHVSARRRMAHDIFAEIFSFRSDINFSGFPGKGTGKKNQGEGGKDIARKILLRPVPAREKMKEKKSDDVGRRLVASRAVRSGRSTDRPCDSR